MIGQTMQKIKAKQATSTGRNSTIITQSPTAKNGLLKPKSRPAKSNKKTLSPPPKIPTLLHVQKDMDNARTKPKSVKTVAQIRIKKKAVKTLRTLSHESRIALF